MTFPDEMLRRGRRAYYAPRANSETGGHMRFTIYGVEHDTELMLAFQTGSMEEPTVYMDQNCLVFVERRVDGAGSMIRLASTKTIAMLADHYGIQPLGLGDPFGTERTQVHNCNSEPQ